jgi:hypothetical protein
MPNWTTKTVERSEIESAPFDEFQLESTSLKKNQTRVTVYAGSDSAHGELIILRQLSISSSFYD